MNTAKQTEAGVSGLLEAALAYAAADIPVFPCKPDKSPLVRNGFHDATKDARLIREWWGKWSTALIAIPTGSASGVAVLDLDTKNGKNGLAAVVGWETMSPVRVRTRSGGAHIYFRADGTIRNTSDKIAPGVDTRGEGGYVIAPGSPGYEWIGESRDLSTLPPWPEAYRPTSERSRASTADSPPVKQTRSKPDRPKLRLVQDDPPAWLSDLNQGGLGISTDPDDLPRKVGIEEIAAVMDVIPNPDLGWEDFNRILMALFAATEGSEEGRRLAHGFAAKSGKYVPDRAARIMKKVSDSVDDRWDHLKTSPPDRLSVGTLFFLADEADEKRGDGRSWRNTLSRKQNSEGHGSDIRSRPYVLVRASDIAPRAKNWLWKGHLLRGSLQLMTGVPGLGKSQLQLDLIARATKGKAWPDGAPGSVEPVNVIMVTAEDALDHEVMPRLIAADADLTRIHILKAIRKDNHERMFLLSEDLAQLAQAIADVGDVGLVALDPITAYMGKVDSHRATDVRGQLAPLVGMAEKADVAISAITHPPKASSQKAIDHFIGSQAFIAAARIGHLCVAETEDKQPTGRVLFTNAKNNSHRMMPTLAYRIHEMSGLGHDPDTGEIIAAPHIVWDNEAVNMTADQAISGAGKESDEVMRYLEGLLADGEPMRAKDIEQRAKEERGFSMKQLHRAKDKLESIRVEKHGAGKDSYWTWQLMI